ncbi:MAG: nascent polypeptide-associated complex protein [Candidatus Micrarchaeaceae archaeon]
MIPNIDPRALKGLMAKMGMKSTDIDAERVIIDCKDKKIIIENPLVTKIEVQGTESFQVSGTISEEEKNIDVKISKEDLQIVMEKSGISDKDLAEKVLSEMHGDIAAAIIKLKEESKKNL